MPQVKVVIKMTEEYKKLCERLKQYRIHYPLTQIELAEKSGVSARSIVLFAYTPVVFEAQNDSRNSRG